MSYILNLPETYEAFGEMNGFGDEEMNGEFVELSKKYYEEAARIIKQLVPLTKEEAETLMEDYLDFREILGVLYDSKRISEDVCYAGCKLFDEMEACSEDEFMVLGFVYDLFEDWISLCLCGRIHE